MEHRHSYIWLAVALLLVSVPALFAQNVINCSSNDMKRHFCSMGRYNNARLVNQKSGSPCIQGSTWGIRGNNLWVDRGCRADFQLMGGGGHHGNAGHGAATVRCNSGDMKYHTCQVNGPISRAQLARQYSGSPCIQGRTWGITRGSLWVDQGCRADFTVWYR